MPTEKIPPKDHWSRDVVYSHLRYRWRIALGEKWENAGDGERGEDVWTFEDAPR